MEKSLLRSACWGSCCAVSACDCSTSSFAKYSRADATTMRRTPLTAWRCLTEIERMGGLNPFAGHARTRLFHVLLDKLQIGSNVPARGRRRYVGKLSGVGLTNFAAALQGSGSCVELLSVLVTHASNHSQKALPLGGVGVFFPKHIKFYGPATYC